MEIIESGMLKESWSRKTKCEHCQCVVRIGLPDLFQMPSSSPCACWECPECGWWVDLTPIEYEFLEKLPTREQFTMQKANNK